MSAVGDTREGMGTLQPVVHRNAWTLFCLKCVPRSPLLRSGGFLELPADDMKLLHVYSCRADTQAHVDEFVRELRKRDSQVALNAFRLNAVFDLPERAVELAATLSIEEVLVVARKVQGGETMVDTMHPCPLVVNPLVRRVRP
jgi:hypothetical protein